MSLIGSTPTIILLLLGLLSITTAVRRRPRPRPRCRNDTLAIENLQIKFDHKQSTKILADGNMTRYLTVSWTLQGASANVSKLDGYLIRMRDADIWKSSVVPFQDPDASLTKLWIRTTNITECSDRDITKHTIDDAITSSEIQCWCNASTCFFLDGLDCSRPSTYFLRDHLGAFYALPNTRRSITYERKYQAQYTIEFYPYYRQFVPLKASQFTLQTAWSCAEEISVVSNISVAEANTKCCERNFLTFSPLDVRTSHFMFDPQTRTLNISISWVPPTTNDSSGAAIRIYPGLNLEPPHRPNHTVIQSEGSYDENVPCKIHNRSDSATIYNLQPNMSYSIDIHTWHSSVERYKYCRSGGCTKNLEINTNLCHASNSKCSDYANCKFDIATFTATCECKPGFTGNGISTKYNGGTGCDPVASTPSAANQPTTIQDVRVAITTTSQTAVIHQNMLSSILLVCSITAAIARSNYF